ncbi:MAG: class I SAM-dependent methyltransferase [Alphaproteobacteria bacterium]
MFDGLADNYDRHRPDYPAPVVAAWRAHLDRGRRRPGPRVVVDLGCGTGISTRALARALDADDILIGAEPSTDMRAEFRANPDTAVRPLVAALGERLPLAGASLDAIVVAQAAHWMDRSALLAEANHALVPGGTFAFLNNNRLWPGSAFLGAYEDVLERLSPGYRRDYRAFDYAAELDEVGAIEVIVRTHMWDRAFDADDFLGLVRSTSMYKNAAKAHERSTVEAEVRSLVAAHADGAGRVVVAYETELVAGRLA